ncbi:MAG TPA: GAF domain-containing protein [Actinomycetes bacterium]|nr:GAF domain-containing protein [Actinomycetes bacterium]
MDSDREHEDAFQLVRAAMSDAVGLLNVTRAAAEAISQLFSSWEITITLLDRDEYWDVVDMSVEQDGHPTFPNYRYPLTDFPIGTSRLLAGKGYVSGDAADEVMVEYARQWPEVPAGSIMSVPIIALGGVHGEIFLVRDLETPKFNRDDLDLASELATLLGARLPALVAAYEELDSGSDSHAMAQLTQNLGDVLNE